MDWHASLPCLSSLMSFSSSLRTFLFYLALFWWFLQHLLCLEGTSYQYLNIFLSFSSLTRTQVLFKPCATLLTTPAPSFKGMEVKTACLGELGEVTVC